MSRIETWGIKFDPARVSAAVAARLADMIKQERGMLPLLENLELRAKACFNHITGAGQIPSILIVQYLNFVRQCWASIRTHRGGVILDQELAALTAFWTSMGLYAGNLPIILHDVLGYRIPNP